MGLLVIIILLALLLVVFLTFALRPKISTPSILRTSTKADNLLNSIIRTSTSENQKMLDLILESYIKGDFTLLEQEITNIIHKTIPNKKYTLKILINQEKILEINTCKTGISSTKQIKHKDNSFKFILLIC